MSTAAPADAASAIAPTTTVLTRAWDIDRFIVLGSVDKLVAVMYCPYFEQIRVGIRPASTQQQSCTANGNRATTRDAAATANQTAFIIEAALMEDTLRRIARRVSRYCCIYFADTNIVHDYDVMYELHAEEPFSLQFYYRNQHVKLDVGTGNYNKINFPIEEDELLSVVEAAFVGAKAGKVVVDSRKQYSQYARRGQP